MGQYASFDANDTLEEQVKNLADEELLDFWQETQQLAKMLDEQKPTDVEYNPEYERVILQELKLRKCYTGQF
ncbi:MAG: hypothetical protein OCC46_08335 [Pseudodesulfovibrio sp.]